MFDFRPAVADDKDFAEPLAAAGSPSPAFAVAKRVFDLVFCMVLLVPTLAIGLVVLVLNLWFNRGPLLFRQERMGHGCRPFRAYKFRSMLPQSSQPRGPFDPVEADRITPFGRILRRSRIDELPQIYNVLRGEMSLIGPRPDQYSHALVYLQDVPGYRERHSVRPGISGYAQVVTGYAQTHESVVAKVAADLHYVRHQSLALDAWIFWRTLRVILLRQGS